MTLLPPLDTQLQLRISRYELAQLNAVSRRLSVPRSMMVRAAIRAIVDDPTLFYSGPLAQPDPEPERVGPPPPPRKSGRRRKRR